MSSNKYEYLCNVQKGRTDWRVKVRIIREWRGKTLSGQPFKGYNLLLLDAKNVRMQAFVPAFIENKLQRMLLLEKMYAITNFQVKDYTEMDKWRCVNMDRHIIFTNVTKAREIQENEYFIANNMFEFYEFAELQKLVGQTLYLADVVGVIIKRDAGRFIQTKHGQQLQVRLKISDGSDTLNVILWDEMAEEFEKEIKHTKFEEPLILIIASGKVGMFKGELDVSNFSPTAYYINYNHHSVVQLRKMCGDPQFTQQNVSMIKPKKELKVCSVDEIKNLTEDYASEEVICQVTVTRVEECDTWFSTECTSCYKQVYENKGKYVCYACNNRIVPEPDKKFGILVIGEDNTGEIEILLVDRPIRTLFGRTVFEMEEQEGGKFPSVFKELETRQFTIKLLIAESNINNEDMYEATDIFEGFTFDDQMIQDYSREQATEYSIEETSGTSMHLDNISQMRAFTEQSEHNC